MLRCSATRQDTARHLRDFLTDTSRSNIIIDKIKKTKNNKGYKINTIKRGALWIGERSLNSLKITRSSLIM